MTLICEHLSSILAEEKIHQFGCFCLELLQGLDLAGKLFILLHNFAEQSLDDTLQLTDVTAVGDAAKVAKQAMEDLS